MLVAPSPKFQAQVVGEWVEVSAKVTSCPAEGEAGEQVKAEGNPDWLAPHRTFAGNHPSTTILL